jgi:IclR family transcriptional regulator, acetate operon repressor
MRIQKSMGTVSKALALIDILARSQGPTGLTGIAKAAGFDKATARRMLLELAANGYVVQNAESRDYELGPALQVLGKIREERFSLYRTILPFVRALSEQTNETVHASEYSAGLLLSICIEHSTKPIRVSLEQGQKLPLHATASGIAFLAASAHPFVESMLKKPLPQFTATTLISRESIMAATHETAARGYSVSNQTLQDGVSSVAAAICDQNAKPIGTLAIAVPSLRMTPQTIAEFGSLVRKTASQASEQLSGRRIKMNKAS